jgi:hypothetical protein
MSLRRLLIPVSLLCALIAVAAISLFIGDAYALGGLTVRQVTPDQVARAMNTDKFYSDFREDTLVVRGEVVAVHTNANGITLEFQTMGNA